MHGSYLVGSVNVNNLAAGIAQVSSRDASGNANGIAGNPIITSPVEAGLAWSYVAASGGIVTATSVTLAAADATGRSAYVRSLQLINTGASATEVYLANGGTAIWRIKLPASMAAPMVVSFGDGQMMTAANTALSFYVATAGAAVFVNAQGFLK